VDLTDSDAYRNGGTPIAARWIELGGVAAPRSRWRPAPGLEAVLGSIPIFIARKCGPFSDKEIGTAAELSRRSSYCDR